MHAVFDASVFVRALVQRETPAVEWVRGTIRREISVAVPALVFAEVANALGGYVQSAAITLDGALRRIAFARRVPLEVRDLEGLLGPALGFAVARCLSVYDGCYAVLAEAEDAVLVTADRRLAEATGRSELLPES